jgi:stringent starvation protein B|nr:ClpXP protease specificity-enhancing factor [Aeromonas sp. RU39B]
MEMMMTPSRPYLLRAFYDWLLDNDLTPHLVVNVNVPHVMVPMQYVQNGQIVLNIAPRAVGGYQMDNEAISFSARFGGVAQQVYVPMAAVVAIHARENGVGTVFPPEPGYEAWLEKDDDEAPAEGDGPQPPRPGGRPSLKVIK